MQTLEDVQRGGFVPELATAAGSDGIRNASAGMLLARGIPALAVTEARTLGRRFVRDRFTHRRPQHADTARPAALMPGELCPAPCLACLFANRPGGATFGGDR